MSFTKTITVYSMSERQSYHRLGVWINRQGEKIAVSGMSYSQLDKLVRMLCTWAMNSDDPITFLKNQPISVHVAQRARQVGLDTHQASLFFRCFPAPQPEKSRIAAFWSRAYCLTCGRSVGVLALTVPAHLKGVMEWCDGPFASCPPPELPVNWHLIATEPSPDELKRMDIHAVELAAQFIS